MLRLYRLPKSLDRSAVNRSRYNNRMPPELDSEIITPELLQTLRAQYRLNWDGVHGYAHWARVRQNGLRLAEMTGANTRVVELFAFLHDICRQNDIIDHGHGQRAADLTVQVCWDADRLDLGRIGMFPAPRFLCTEAARRQEIIDWAYRRSLGQ